MLEKQFRRVVSFRVPCSRARAHAFGGSLCLLVAVMAVAAVTGGCDEAGDAPSEQSVASDGAVHAAVNES